MNTFKERILKILETEGINKTEFANKLNITQSYVSRIINSGAIPSERLMEDICEKFNICMDWLHNGTEPMYMELNKAEELTEWINKNLNNQSNSFKNRLLRVLMSLEESEWEFLEKKAEELVNLKIKSSDTIASSSPKNQTKKTSIDERVADYRHQLELEEKAKEKSEVSQESA